jgi:hypothetical protein
MDSALESFLARAYELTRSATISLHSNADAFSLLSMIGKVAALGDVAP